MTQSEVQNGTTLNTTYSYDDIDRMTEYSVSDGTGAAYTFDGYNRATETVTANGTSTTKSYSYDETDWLKTVEGGSNTVTYAYDQNGNTIRKSESGATVSETAYDYDANNRLVRAMQGGTLLGLYDYNAEGMRVRHRNSDRGDVDYFYDGRSVIDERAPGGGLLAHYNYADKLLSLATPSGTQYYHLDALGSTVNLTDGQGSVQTSYFLNPWGTILRQIGESANRRVFTGKEVDGKTGLVYFGARYYDADTGRFVSKDSYLGKTDTPPSLHRYLYAYANPLVYIDLLGYASEEWRALPEKPFFDKWIFDREHAKDIYRGVVNGSAVGAYRPESARTDAAMDLIRTGLEAKVAGEVVGAVAGKLKQPAKNLLKKIEEKLPEVVNSTIKSVVKLTTEAKGGLKDLGQELLDKTKTAYTNSPLANNRGQIVIRKGAGEGAERVAAESEAKLWAKSEFKGQTVYQRNDLIDPDLVDARGRTNLERLEKGLAPVGPDGKSINLHHSLQSNDSAIVELTQTFHQKNSKVIHINPSSTPSGIDREAFEAFKRDYWKSRSTEYK